MAYWCVLLIICLPTALSAADDRLILNAKINGDEIRLAYDTGSPASLIIFKSTAKRLRLNVAEENGKAVATFELEIGGEKIHNAKAILIDFLPFPDIEGLVGWPAFRGKLWRVQWDNMSLSLIPTLPNEILSRQSRACLPYVSSSVRNIRRMILPELVVGTPSTNWTWRGTL